MALVNVLSFHASLDTYEIEKKIFFFLPLLPTDMDNLSWVVRALLRSLDKDSNRSVFTVFPIFMAILLFIDE